MPLRFSTLTFDLRAAVFPTDANAVCAADVAVAYPRIKDQSMRMAAS
jgi:hypothetical protein